MDNKALDLKLSMKQDMIVKYLESVRDELKLIVEEARHIGENYYIIKPCHYAKLKELVKKE